jgi:hypothetical protein
MLNANNKNQYLMSNNIFGIFHIKFIYILKALFWKERALNFSP